MAGRIAATSIVEAIAADLRSRIFAGDLGPGQTLTETEAASCYKVARPTAKASIEKLVAEGLLDRSTHKTARVPDLGPDSVREIYFARAHLESEVLRRLARARNVPAAAVQANRDIAAARTDALLDIVEADLLFHTSLIDAMGNKRISRMYHSLVGEVRLCMVRVQSLHLLDAELILAEHRRILELIEEGHGEAAAELLDEHLGGSRDRLVAAMEGTAGPEAEPTFGLLPKQLVRR